MPNRQFTRVVCGIDGTREGFEAARQAARITSPDGRLVLVAVTDYLRAISGRWGPELVPWDLVEMPGRNLDALNAALRARAEESLAWAERQVGDALRVQTLVVSARVPEALRDAAEREDAQLIAVGAHGGRRVVGAALGRVATMLLHDSPASVLLARRPFDPCRFPARVVVGFDGSDAGLRARDVAVSLCEVSGGSLTLVVAAHDEQIEAAALAAEAAPHAVRVDQRRPVEALVEAAAAADLLVVGSRGMSGLRALGSVSERVAHLCASSVLVVRS